MNRSKGKALHALRQMLNAIREDRTRPWTKVDRAFFAGHPDKDYYVRPPLDGELDHYGTHNDLGVVGTVTDWAHRINPDAEVRMLVVNAGYPPWRVPVPWYRDGFFPYLPTSEGPQACSVERVVTAVQSAAAMSPQMAHFACTRCQRRILPGVLFFICEDEDDGSTLNLCKQCSLETYNPRITVSQIAVCTGDHPSDLDGPQARKRLEKTLRALSRLEQAGKVDLMSWLSRGG